MTLKKSDTGYWDQRRRRISSTTGGWVIGEGVFCHGYNMLDELMGEVSYFQLMFLSAVGHLPEKRLADWVEATFMCLSWPDSRIWCNQIGALAGSARTSPVAACSAGILASDSEMYGSRPLLEGVRFIQGALLQYRQDDGRDCCDKQAVEQIVDAELKKHRGKLNIMGYARPIARGDERVEAIQRVTDKLEFNQGEHLKLAYEISDHLFERFGESMNINGYVSAFMADQGYSPEEVYLLSTLCVSSGVMACYVDYRNRPVEDFLPLRCDDIDYQGAPLRELPERWERD